MKFLLNLITAIFIVTVIIAIPWVIQGIFRPEKISVIDGQKLSEHSTRVYNKLLLTCPSTMRLSLTGLGLNKDTVIYASVIQKINYNQDSTIGTIIFADTVYYKVYIRKGFNKPLDLLVDRIDTKEIYQYLSFNYYLLLRSWFKH